MGKKNLLENVNYIAEPNNLLEYVSPSDLFASTILKQSHEDIDAFFGGVDTEGINFFVREVLQNRPANLVFIQDDFHTDKEESF